MSVADFFIVCGISLVFAGLPAAGAVYYVYRKNALEHAKTLSKLGDLSDRLSMIDSSVVRSSIALEGSFTETIRKVQAEIKSLEIVFRGAGQTTRENPESVDAAIRLAREGVSSDLIVAKTGLPVHAVESIISLHGRR
jgi:uncharacterized protein